MSIQITSAKFQLFVVFWPVYDIRIDEMIGRCFRMRIGSWHFPKRKDKPNGRTFFKSL